MTAALLERVYRREYGRVVSVLVSRLGVQHLELVEDAVQAAWASALSHWPRHGAPDNPTAWLFRAAHNHALDRLRTDQRRASLRQQLGDAAPEMVEAPNTPLAGELPDAQLAMLLVCCDPVLPLEGRRVLALEILFGFRVREIAEHLFASPTNVYKRLQRSKAKLRSQGRAFDSVSNADVATRLPSALSVLHTLFSEGYASLRADETVRADICDEAIRLTTLVAGHRCGDTPQTAALLALMHLHRARLSARVDGVGGLLLLAEQDRSRWDAARIAEGMRWLARSAQGAQFSRYHAEAGIAAEHSRAPRFEDTRWDRVVACYALLERAEPSALHRLGHAIALAEWKGPEAGLAFLRDVAPPAWLEGSFPWFAVSADLHHRCGRHRDAQRLRALALDAAPTAATRELLARRLAAIDPEV